MVAEAAAPANPGAAPPPKLKQPAVLPDKPVPFIVTVNVRPSLPTDADEIVSEANA
jgi:hypothetical protein